MCMGEGMLSLLLVITRLNSESAIFVSLDICRFKGISFLFQNLKGQMQQIELYNVIKWHTLSYFIILRGSDAANRT